MARMISLSQARSLQVPAGWSRWRLTTSDGEARDCRRRAVVLIGLTTSCKPKPPNISSRVFELIFLSEQRMVVQRRLGGARLDKLESRTLELDEINSCCTNSSILRMHNTTVSP
jgi:hypothetical protein